MEVESLRGVEIGKITLGVNFAMLMMPNSPNQRQTSAKKITAKSQRSVSPLDMSRYPSERRDVASFEEDYMRSQPRKS